MNILTKEKPTRLKMGYEEFLAWADEDTHAEWVDGEVIVHMPPVYMHQDIVVFLGSLLRSFVQFFNLGRIIVAPFEVKLWPNGPSREPDILFISTGNLSKLTPERFAGGPDLVIEIISPGSVAIDRVDKFSEYQQAGVREYWLIDPRPHQQQADFYRLGEDNLYHPAPIDEAGRYHSTILPGFWLKLDWLRQDPLPNPQLPLAEIMISLETLPAEVRQAYRALYEALR